jgi:hypothetical protein
MKNKKLMLLAGAGIVAFFLLRKKTTTTPTTTPTETTTKPAQKNAVTQPTTAQKIVLPPNIKVAKQFKSLLNLKPKTLTGRQVDGFIH